METGGGTGKDNSRRGSTGSKKQGGDEEGEGRRKAPASQRCISVLKSIDPGLLRNLPQERAFPGLATSGQAYTGSACAAHGTAATGGSWEHSFSHFVFLRVC